jgi:hypothetical protein
MMAKCNFIPDAVFGQVTNYAIMKIVNRKGNGIETVFE